MNNILSKTGIDNLSKAVTNAFMVEIINQHKQMVSEIKSIIAIVDTEFDQEIADQMTLKVESLKALISDMECES